MTTKAVNQHETLDVYSLVTDRIIAELEKGTVPWKQPWTAGDMPRNLLTMSPYRGINLLLLAMQEYPTNYYLTFDQLKAVGGSVLKDEKGHLVVFYKRTPKEKEKPEDTQEYLSVLRYYKVFNIAQCKDVPQRLVPSTEQQTFSPLTACEEIVEGMPNCPVIKHGKQEAYYHPLKDYVNMPKQGSFASIESYYHVLFHELIHSTGHQSRLNRKEITENVNYGSELYSLEELTAEIGACFLGSTSGIGIADFDNSLSYIKGWLEVLKNDKRIFVYAASRAQRAVNFILNLQ